jgi:hypothetical protein
MFWEFLEQVKTIAKTFSLPENWLNTGPESYLKTGLPGGFLERLTWKNYRENLHIGYISRLDQIFFKLFAAVDRGGYHVQDLHQLHPTTPELLAAAHWVLTQDISREFRLLLIDCLKKIGYEDAAAKI